MATKQSSRKSSSRKTGSRESDRGGRKSASRRAADDRRRGSSTPGGVSSSRASAGGGRAGGRKSASKSQSRAGGGRGAKGTGRGGRSTEPSGGAESRASARKGGSRGTSSARSRKTSGRAVRMDALKLLKEDHDRVDQMFKKYERMKEGDQRKQALLQQILEEVRVHAQVEEEVFYPALRAQFEQRDGDKELDLIEEADVEHGTVKWLMEQLESGDQSDEKSTDARVKVMGEYIRHHVQEEEGPIFRAAKKAGVDLDELGRQIDARKRQLKGEEPAEAEGGEGGETGMQINEPAQMASGRTTH